MTIDTDPTPAHGTDRPSRWNPLHWSRRTQLLAGAGVVILVAVAALSPSSDDDTTTVAVTEAPVVTEAAAAPEPVATEAPEPTTTLSEAEMNEQIAVAAVQVTWSNTPKAEQVTMCDAWKVLPDETIRQQVMDPIDPSDPSREAIGDAFIDLLWEECS